MQRDLTYAARRWRRQPTWFLTICATIALGIGATASTFTLFNAVILRPLPYGSPDRLVLVSDDRYTRKVRDYPFSDANFFDLRNATTRTLEDLAAVQTVDGILDSVAGTLEAIHVAVATPNFFRVLGTHITVGRDFDSLDTASSIEAQERSTAAGSPPTPSVAILSYEYWRRRHGGSSDILGRPLYLNGPTIIGVLPPQFELLFPSAFNVERQPDVWLAGLIRYDPNPVNRDFLRRRVIGRLRPGVTLVQAQSEADAVATRLRTDYVSLGSSGFHIRLEPLQQYLI